MVLLIKNCPVIMIVSTRVSKGKYYQYFIFRAFIDLKTILPQVLIHDLSA